LTYSSVQQHSRLVPDPLKIGNARSMQRQYRRVCLLPNLLRRIGPRLQSVLDLAVRAVVSSREGGEQDGMSAEGVNGGDKGGEIGSHGLGASNLHVVVTELEAVEA
jgi:hypothetical protein